MHAALAVVYYKLGELEQSQDLYARAYDIQVRQADFSALLAIFNPSGVSSQGSASRLPVYKGSMRRKGVEARAPLCVGR